MSREARTPAMATTIVATRIEPNKDAGEKDSLAGIIEKPNKDTGDHGSQQNKERRDIYEETPKVEKSPLVKQGAVSMKETTSENTKASEWLLVARKSKASTQAGYRKKNAAPGHAKKNLDVSNK